MNILILTSHFETGGITSYVRTLAKGLKKKNHNVVVASSGGNMVADLSSFEIEHLLLNIRTSSELNPKIYIAIPKLLRFIKEKKIDLIHTHTRVTQVIGTLLSRWAGVAHVSTCHGFFKPRLVRKIFPCWGKGVIAISQPVRQHLIKDLHVAERKVCFIHNGIELEDFLIIDEETKVWKKKELHLDQGPVIGIIARLSDVKGHDILIAAMKRVVEKIPSAVLLIVGKGKLEEPLKKMVNDFHLEHHIRFYPIVNQTAQILSLLDVFVMPSRQEGLGLSVMEAQAMGLPVVASKIGGLPSLVHHGENGYLVTVGDIEGFSEAILTVLHDKEKAKQMGKAARKFIQEEFAAERMVEETLKFYRSCVIRESL